MKRFHRAAIFGIAICLTGCILFERVPASPAAAQPVHPTPEMTTTVTEQFNTDTHFSDSRVCKNGHSLALVFDKSGSFGSSSLIEDECTAIVSVLHKMRESVRLYLVAFDSSPFIIAPNMLMTKENKLVVERRLKNLIAAGKTNPLPALEMANKFLKDAPETCKSLVFLSDGKFPLDSDAFVGNINELRRNNIIASAIAIGVDGDIPFLKLFAKYGGGSFSSASGPKSVTKALSSTLSAHAGVLDKAK